MTTNKVATGLDSLRENNFKQLHGSRVGVLANASAVDSNLNHILDLLLKEKALTVVRLFAPEHGFRNTAQDMETVDESVDTLTGTPVVSLYGDSEESLKPRAHQIDDLDVIIVDLPDIGTRYYTFAQSLGYMLQAAAPLGKKVLVVDRPNPINGESVEGPTLVKSCRSFCGYAPVPPRHGMTLGELALLMNKGFGEGENRIDAINAALEIAQVKNWNRKDYFDQTALPWVLPSPNMPTLDTAIVYPGACLFEATNISEGRGTTRPFELIGAPWINSTDWIHAISKHEIKLQGVHFRPVNFIPQFQKHAGKHCSGVQIHVTNRETFRPFRTSLVMLSTIFQLYPDECLWRTAAYEFKSDTTPIDLLYGSSEFRKTLETGASFGPLLKNIEAFENWFQEARKPFLLY